MALSVGSYLKLAETDVTPDTFLVKIIGVELVSDDGKYVAIWAGEGCTPQEWDVDIGGKSEMGMEETSSYKSVEHCNVSDITKSIDIAKPIADVNTEINSGSFPVPPGIYTEVSIRMCGPQDTDETMADALEFQAGEMSASHKYGSSTCGVTGAPTSSIEIGDGQSATIDLSYDQGALVSKGTHEVDVSGSYGADVTSNECILGESNTITYCGKFGAYTFTPSLK